MDSFEAFYYCSTCLSSTVKRLRDCSHCQLSFCDECLLKHQHTDLHARLLKQIQKIDTIVGRFANHAHTQTEWVDHLVQDRFDLQIFVSFIERTAPHLTVTHLPKELWLDHVDDLIVKDCFAIEDQCTWLLRPPKIQFLNHSSVKRARKLSG